MTVYVTGHKNPDTDATIAPILLAYVLEQLYGVKATPILQGKPNKEVQYVFNYFDVQLPQIITEYTQEDKFYVVDTTNPGELPDTLQEHEVLGIVDHHKLAGLTTNKPVITYIMPYGSSATVILDFYVKNGGSVDNMPKTLQGLALSAIVSDTLNLTSPTTTEHDKQLVTKLKELLNIDIDELANNMFEAKSDVSDLSGMDIVTYDAKKYEFGGVLTYVAVFETVKPNNVFEKYDQIRKALRDFRKQKGFKHTLLFVIDIMNQNAYYFRYCKRSDALIRKTFNVVEETDKYFKIPGVVSRKKQIVPLLEKQIAG